ncbi:restriction endonuclease subunit S [Undibacterium macrobrachii]|uniref:Type I restriction endonuclease EcoAI subunit S n=1 Tax=Undibacterium macrobrachii TaxID=1119058 RepID=A0ABQ2XM84_9BURK|nr:restriction endonuclease subunit S [Undibacterium macrobrachii]GGX23101.1 type I restriction endonuclease EcoAI subunit S [Undibacterium macrobrachii]
MSAVHKLITDHLEIWTAADTEKKSGRGRVSGSANSVYGIKKLRELILELAVRGKLVPQDPNDEPASELLKRIQVEKAKLIADGKIKGGKPLPEITTEEKPFKLPYGWEWARLNDFVLNIISGGTPSKNNSEFWNGDIPWASVKDLNVEKFLESTQDFITQKGLDAGSKLAQKGDLIICTRMGLGKIAIAAMNVAINQDLKALKVTSFLDIDYFINFYGTLKIIGSGMTVAGIRQDELLQYCIPTPPLAEQHRIVAKIDELMVLCDQLEHQHNNAAEAHEQLVSHLLGTLTQSQDPDDFNANWQRIADHFDTLFTTESCIEALKQTILQLAVMGKLVRQDPNDEPASELLKRIQAEKAKLVAEGKIKKDKALATVSDSEELFKLPSGWSWTRMINCAKQITDGEHLTPERTTDNTKIPLITAKNVRDGSMDYTTTDFVDFDVASKCWNRCKPEPNDILIVSVGATIGRLTMIEDHRDMVIVRSVTLVKPLLINIRYLTMALRSPSLQKTIWAGVKQNAQPCLYLAVSNNLPIPVPPINEQHRIVSKVGQLMVLCDQLKSRITNMRRSQQKLADVLIEHAPTR